MPSRPAPVGSSAVFALEQCCLAPRRASERPNCAWARRRRRRVTRHGRRPPAAWPLSSSHVSRGRAPLVGAIGSAETERRARTRTKDGGAAGCPPCARRAAGRCMCASQGRSAFKLDQCACPAPCAPRRAPRPKNTSKAHEQVHRPARAGSVQVLMTSHSKLPGQAPSLGGFYERSR
jgi:hypothetical protein